MTNVNYEFNDFRTTRQIYSLDNGGRTQDSPMDRKRCSMLHSILPNLVKGYGLLIPTLETSNLLIIIPLVEKTCGLEYSAMGEFIIAQGKGLSQCYNLK